MRSSYLASSDAVNDADSVVEFVVDGGYTVQYSSVKGRAVRRIHRQCQVAVEVSDAIS